MFEFKSESQIHNLFNDLKVRLRSEIKDDGELALTLTLENAKKRLWQIIRKNRKKVLLLCVFLSLIFVTAVVSAVIYNSMFMESGIGVKG